MEGGVQEDYWRRGSRGNDLEGDGVAEEVKSETREQVGGVGGYGTKERCSWGTVAYKYLRYRVLFPSCFCSWIGRKIPL